MRCLQIENFEKNELKGVPQSPNQEYVVEQVIASRIFDGEQQYLLKWKGYSNRENSWEPLSNIYCHNLIEKFECARQHKIAKKIKNNALRGESDTKKRKRKDIEEGELSQNPHANEVSRNKKVFSKDNDVKMWSGKCDPQSFSKAGFKFRSELMKKRKYNSKGKNYATETMRAESTKQSKSDTSASTSSNERLAVIATNDFGLCNGSKPSTSETKPTILTIEMHEREFAKNMSFNLPLASTMENKNLCKIPKPLILKDKPTTAEINRTDNETSAKIIIAENNLCKETVSLSVNKKATATTINVDKTDRYIKALPDVTITKITVGNYLNNGHQLICVKDKPTSAEVGRSEKVTITKIMAGNDVSRSREAKLFSVNKKPNEVDKTSKVIHMQSNVIQTAHAVNYLCKDIKSSIVNKKHTRPTELLCRSDKGVKKFSDVTLTEIKTINGVYKESKSLTVNNVLTSITSELSESDRSKNTPPNVTLTKVEENGIFRAIKLCSVNNKFTTPNTELRIREKSNKASYNIIHAKSAKTNVCNENKCYRSVNTRPTTLTTELLRSDQCVKTVGNEIFTDVSKYDASKGTKMFSVNYKLADDQTDKQSIANVAIGCRSKRSFNATTRYKTISSNKRETIDNACGTSDVRNHGMVKMTNKLEPALSSEPGEGNNLPLNNEALLMCGPEAYVEIPKSLTHSKGKYKPKDMKNGESAKANCKDTCISGPKNTPTVSSKCQYKNYDNIVISVIEKLERKSLSTNRLRALNLKLQPESIVGGTEVASKLVFLIKSKGRKKIQLVPAKLAYKICPQIVIQYYQSRLVWKNPVKS